MSAEDLDTLFILPISQEAFEELETLGDFLQLQAFDEVEILGHINGAMRLIPRVSSTSYLSRTSRRTQSSLGSGNPNARQELNSLSG
jgi:hypothetical protein